MHIVCDGYVCLKRCILDEIYFEPFCYDTKLLKYGFQAELGVKASASSYLYGLNSVVMLGLDCNVKE